MEFFRFFSRTKEISQSQGIAKIKLNNREFLKMCGIVGYIGQGQAFPYLLNALKLLEYRGYDSSGIALYDAETGLTVSKCQGKLAKLIEKTSTLPMNGTMGIGHTRWATQGVPSDINAHPHLNGKASVAIVHNGIIANYSELKQSLVAKGINFVSETDSEVLAHLVGCYLEEGMNLKAALRKVTEVVEGSYAICVICADEPDKLMMTCHDAPLVIGLGSGGDLFCASDSMAILQYTNRVIRLKESQIAELRADGSFSLFDRENQLVSEPEVQLLSHDPLSLDKKGYKHYLLKEIHEQPAVLRSLLESHLPGGQNVSIESLDQEALKNVTGITLLGCGTAYYAALVGKYVLEHLAKIPVQVEFSSEQIQRPVLMDKDSLVIAVSQSGETADTLLAVKACLREKIKVIAITNRLESSLSTIADAGSFFLNAGAEISVAATKSFSAQLMCLYLLALKLASLRGTLPEGLLQTLQNDLRCIPQLLEQTLSRAEQYKDQILPYSGYQSFIFLGRGVNYPLAMEGALKLKELTYVQAAGYASGEMKHGPIATIDENVPTLSIIVPGELLHKTLHNCIEAKTRGAPSLGIIADGDLESAEQLDAVFSIPSIGGDLPESLRDLFTPFLAVIPLQLMAYYLAEYLGKDVDQPRNLAKSVTVE